MKRPEIDKKVGRSLDYSVEQDKYIQHLTEENERLKKLTEDCGFPN